MTTTVVTRAVGGTAKPVGSLYLEPACEILDAGSATALADSGLNPAVLADLLSACLAHERCGVHLYRSVAGRTSAPKLREQYEHFGSETLEHVVVLEQLIADAGGNPCYVSPMARATEAAASAILESTFMLRGSVDPMTAEIAMLEAVLLAEAKDRANWELLADLSTSMADGALRDQLQEAATEVLAQEEEHHSWALVTRADLLTQLASGLDSGSAVVDLRSLSRDDLYEQAQALGIEGRSKMSKDELVEAVTTRVGRAQPVGGGR
jgi:rubrerythrin